MSSRTAPSDSVLLAGRQWCRQPEAAAAAAPVQNWPAISGKLNQLSSIKLLTTRVHQRPLLRPKPLLDRVSIGPIGRYRRPIAGPSSSFPDREPQRSISGVFHVAANNRLRTRSVPGVASPRCNVAAPRRRTCKGAGRAGAAGFANHRRRLQAGDRAGTAATDTRISHIERDMAGGGEGRFQSAPRRHCRPRWVPPAHPRRGGPFGAIQSDCKTDEPQIDRHI